jgi:hypothetical protein
METSRKVLYDFSFTGSNKRERKIEGDRRAPGVFSVSARLARVEYSWTSPTKIENVAVRLALPMIRKSARLEHMLGSEVIWAV